MRTRFFLSNTHTHTYTLMLIYRRLESLLDDEIKTHVGQVF